MDMPNIQLDTFIGNSRYNLDDKGRVVIPAKFRELLGNNFVLCKDLYNIYGENRVPAICAYPLDKFKILADKVAKMSGVSDEVDDIVEKFFSSANTYEPDKQGRILLPNFLRDYAGIEREAMVVGKYDHMCIYSAEKWDQKSDRSGKPNPYKSDIVIASFKDQGL